MRQDSVLLRHSLGSVLRAARVGRGLTLRELSAAARISLGYISEVERGQKEASSELVSALCDALELPLSAVLREVSEVVAREERVVGAVPVRLPHVSGMAGVRGGDVVASAA